MSKAEEFRRATEEFWSRMDQKGRPAAGSRKPTLTRGKSDSGNRPGTRRRSALAVAAARKTKRELSADRPCVHFDEPRCAQARMEVAECSTKLLLPPLPPRS